MVGRWLKLGEFVGRSARPNAVSLICDLRGSSSWRERLGYLIKALGGGRTIDDQPHTKVASGFVQVMINDVRPTTQFGIVVGGALIRVERGFDPNGPQVPTPSSRRLLADERM